MKMKPVLSRSVMTVFRAICVAALTASLLYALPASAILVASNSVDGLGAGGPDVGLYTSLVLNASGFPVISYHDATNNSLKVAVCTDATCSPGHVISNTVDASTPTGLYPSIKLNAAGNPVIGYYAGDGITGTLKVAVCGNATCSVAAPITRTVVDASTSNVGGYTSLELNASGNPVMSYYEYTIGMLKLAQCSNATCTSVVSNTVSATGGQYSSLKLKAGNPVISYYDETVGLRLALCSDASCATTPTIVPIDSAANPFTQHVGQYSSLALNGSGFPVISYLNNYDSGNSLGNLKVAVCQNAACGSVVSNTVDASSDLLGLHTSLKLNGDNPVISYFDATNVTLKVALCSNASCAGTVISQTLDNSGSVGGFTSLALNAAGKPVVSYYDSNAGDLLLSASVPLITVVGNGAVIVNGDDTPTTGDKTDFGSLTLGQALTNTFTISNTGDGALNLTGTPFISFSGAGAAYFSVVVSPTTPIAFTGTTTFQVRYAPTVTGTHTATVSIANDDYLGLNNPYTFTVRGTGTNLAPTANAGTNQTRPAGSTVTLNGSGSSDPDGHTLTYGWRQTGGVPAVTLSSATTVSPTFTAPGVGTSNVLTFSLTVTDAFGLASTAATTIVTVTNTAPTANAGANQSAAAGSTVTLNGNASADAESNYPLLYGWRQTGGSPAVTLNNATTVTPTFTAPGVGTSNVLTFSLTVTDVYGLASTAATTVVTVTNTAPTANAGASQSVAAGSTVTLNGGGTSDPDGHALTYHWAQTGGTGVTLSSSSAISPTFSNAPGVGTSNVLTFSLTVTDVYGLASTAATTVVTVTNTAPTANAGTDQNVSMNTLVTLNSSGSSDPDGHALTRLWAQTGGPAMSLSNSSAVSPTFTSPTFSYPTTSVVLTFAVTVTDAFGLESAPDTVVVTVTNQAPVANAGSDQIVNPQSAVTLDGNASADPDGHTPLAYLWAQTGGPSVALNNASNVTATFAAPNATTVLTFTLTVTDAYGLASAADVVQVTVGAVPGYGSSPAAGNLINVGATIAVLGAPVSTTLTISETGTAQLDISNISLTGADAADFTVSPNTPFSIADGGAAHNLTISCRPTATGLRTATLTVTHNAAGSPATYTLNCTGTPPLTLFLPLITR